MNTLLELLPAIQALGDREAVRYHNGYRTWKFSYLDLRKLIGGFVVFIDQHGCKKRDRILLWGENRAEWVAAFWGSVARGVEVVPIDFHSSPAFVRRIQSETGARLLVLGAVQRALLLSESTKMEAETLTLSRISHLPQTSCFEVSPVQPADVVEIVYTSGTTSEPKGVVHRHSNICANLNPIRAEIERYRVWARPFQPIRLLDMLPLSHMFGQSAGLFIAPMLGGAVVFTNVYSPGPLVETCRRERVSALITVPQLAENLRNQLQRKFASVGRSCHRHGWAGVAERWLVHRDVHRALGWKFWCLTVGGAALDPELEDFWKQLGFVVVQGYGLTETSPVVAINHPFHSKRGSIGKPIAGQEVKIASDGEILVRGASVVTEYIGGQGSSGTRFEGGWLHTGDLGRLDADGRLYYRGRKKDVIVTADGLNVFPRDIESVLNRQPEIQESVVVGLADGRQEQIHAVLIFRSGGASPRDLIRRVNEQLEPHQRIQDLTIWPEHDFPRTASMHKIRRREVLRRVKQYRSAGGPQPRSAGGVRSILAEISGHDAASLDPGQHLEQDLGLRSLQRMELMARLEDEFAVEVDEEQFARLNTIGELESTFRFAENAKARTGARETKFVSGAEDQRTPVPEAFSQPADAAASPSRPTSLPASLATSLPRWSRFFLVRWSRRLLLDALLLPAMRQIIKLRVEDKENLAAIRPPVIFAANHLSHFDTACILAALPFALRGKISPAMSQDYFRDFLEHRNVPRRRWWTLGAQLFLACLLFNAYPLPRKMSGARRALQYTGDLISRGFCPLVFPEGQRSPTGTMQPFMPGIGLMAMRLEVPVVPVHISGAYQVYSIHHDWPEPGEVRVRFGPPLSLEDAATPEQAAARVEEAVRLLGAGNG